MKHRHPKSESGKTTVGDIMSALRAKGVERKHKVTRQLPEIIEDPEGVADFMATHEAPPVADPELLAAAEAREEMAKLEEATELPPLGTPEPGLLHLDKTDFTEEELFRMRRRAAREKLREREEP